jgi:phosphate acetyltransferase
MLMMAATSLKDVIDLAGRSPRLRVAVADAAQKVVLETMREAVELGIAEPRLIGDVTEILALCHEINWEVKPDWLVESAPDGAAAIHAVRMVHEGAADIVMKGNLHTDVFMRPLLDAKNGLRLPGRRVSHLFVVEHNDYGRLIGITDAAINITPDLNAKAQICQNAVDAFHALGLTEPRVAILSAVETVTTEIVSTIDAAALTLMAQRGQINGAILDGPLAFDNAVSPRAAAEKGIVSDVAGVADILLVPDLVSGNVLAKALEYLAGATAAGLALGMSAPVVLNSRADTQAARLGSLALAVLMAHSLKSEPFALRQQNLHRSLRPLPQPEAQCCSLPHGAVGHSAIAGSHNYDEK